MELTYDKKSSEIIKIQVAFKFMRAVVQTLFTWLSLGPPSDAAREHVRHVRGGCIAGRRDVGE